MYEVLVDILDAMRAQGQLDALELGQILNRHNKQAGTRERMYSKKRLLPYYLKLKEEDPGCLGRSSALTRSSNVSSSRRCA